MKLLLDTHTLIWALGDPKRLPAMAAELIRDPSNELLVSAVTAFEIALKYRLGKLPEVEQIVVAYSEVLSLIGGTELPVSSHHGLIAGQLAWEHRDPFDRLLAAQSVTENLSLITSDPVFATAGGVSTIWD